MRKYITFVELEKLLLTAISLPGFNIKEIAAEIGIKANTLYKWKTTPVHLSPEKIDMSAYTKYTFSMYGGEPQPVTMVFDNDMACAVMDRFGSRIMMMREDDAHFLITVNVAVSGQFFGWVFGLGKKARIVAPESVKAQMKNELAIVMEKYNCILSIS